MFGCGGFEVELKWGCEKVRRSLGLDKCSSAEKAEFQKMNSRSFSNPGCALK